MKKSIIPLTLGGLSIGTTEFVVMGILPNMANYFGITVSQAGQFISLYALGVVIGAPFIVLLSGKMKPKRILLFLMIAFTLFNALSVFSPSASFLSITRFFSGLPHGAFFGVGSIVASRLAAEGKEAKNISLMFLGLTVANLVMVPLGTYLGQQFSWQVTLGLVALIGLITCISIYSWLPDLPIRKKISIGAELSFFKTKEAWLITFMTALGTGGGFAWLSYIAPLMTENAGVQESFMMYIMILVGLGMVIGNLIGGRLADRVAPVKACMIIFLIIAANLMTFFLFSEVKWLALLLCFTCGASFLALASPIQLLMLRTAKDAEMISAGVTQASFNIGNSLGAYLGGLILMLGYGFQFPSLAGFFLALIGFALAFTFYRVADT
tara:strand:+ start:298 stop:1443 length:1146 start_codon:yes stop_codon:yes gene_type:complete